MKSIDYVGKRKTLFLVSIAVIILGILGVVIAGGPTLSIDHQGGTIIEVGMKDNDYSASALKALIQDLIGKNVTVEKTQYDYDSSAVNKDVKSKNVKLDIRIQSDKELTEAEQGIVSNYLKKKFTKLETVPAPKYHEKAAPYVAQYQLDVKEISSDNDTEYQKSLEEIEKELAAQLSANGQAKRVSTAFSYRYEPNALVIKKYKALIKITGAENMPAEEIQKVKNAVGEEFGIVVSENAVDYKVSNVSPVIGRKTLQNNILIVLIAIVVVAVYAGIRYRGISGGTVAFITLIVLLYSAMATCLVYAILGTMNGYFMGVILAALGYTIYNVVVVFDKIAEHLNSEKKLSSREAVNLSVTQTMKRCLITTLCLAGSLLILFVFACIRNFPAVTGIAIPMLFGILIGAFSSVLLAPGLWGWWKDRRNK